jgi:hypothetical protein
MFRPAASLLLFCAALSLTACSADTTGADCAESADCQAGQTCYTDFPGGYCAKGCTTEGADKACGTGSVCSRSGERLLCAATCETKADCREGYECNGVTGSNLKSCRPKA